MFTFEKNAEKTTNMILIPKFFLKENGDNYDIIDEGNQIIIKKGYDKSLTKVQKLRLPQKLINKYGRNFYMQVFEDHLILTKRNIENK